MKKILILFHLLFFVGKETKLFSQPKQSQTKIDSLFTVLKTSEEDTNKVKAMVLLGWELRNSNPDTSILIETQALEIIEKLSGKLSKVEDTVMIYTLKKWAANAKGHLGVYAKSKGNFSGSLILLLEALAIDMEIENKKGQAKHLGNIGTVYSVMGNYNRALDYYLKALKMDEELSKAEDSATAGNSLNGVARHLGNIGILYEEQGEASTDAVQQKELFNKALAYYNRALKIYGHLNDNRGSSNVLGNIGVVYRQMGDLEKTLEYYNKALEIDRATENKFGIARHLGNIGNVYGQKSVHEQNKMQKKVWHGKALEYYTQSLQIKKELGQKEEIATTISNMGSIHTNMSEFAKAKSLLTEALEIARVVKSLRLMKDVNNRIRELYEKKGDWKQAHEYYKQYIVFRDSINNNENTEERTQLEMQFEFDKKEAATKAEQDKKDAIAIKELQRQKLARNGFMGGFAVVLLFAGVFFTQRNKIQKGKKRSDELLLNILPEEVAEELKAKGSADAKQFDEVTVMFTDFKGFTQISEKLSPTELVNEIHTCFKAFDHIISKHNIEKIKTIGDAYMCAGGLPVANATHADDVIKAALEIQKFMLEHLQQRESEGKDIFEIRIGIHTGTVVAGIVGVKKFAYDIWGDTVNIASRMESSGEAGKVNISGSTYELVKDKFNCIHRGKIKAKHKGEIDMYFAEKLSSHEQHIR